MEVDRDPMSKTTPLHADKRGTELNEKEQQLLALTLATLGNHINTYWAQRQWRIDRTYMSFTSREDTYDTNCTVYFFKPEEYSEKIVERLKGTLKSCGFHVNDTSKKNLVIQIDKKNINKNKCAFPAGKKILKKQKSSNQTLLKQVEDLVRDAVFQNKCERYDFTFDGFDPKVISKYIKKIFTSDSGFAVKPPKTRWHKKIVRLDEKNYMFFYRPVTTFSLISEEISCFALRSRVRLLTNCYDQTFHFGGLESEI